MIRAPYTLAIDARPRGPRGPLAAEPLLGKSVLERLLEQAAALADPAQPIHVHAREDDQRALRVFAQNPHPGGVRFETGPPRAGAVVLTADRLYDTRRLRRGLRRGHDPESAVIWRLDRPETLAAADDELKRRTTYQPLGAYWAFPLADRLSARLCETRVTPNALTLAAGFLMLTACGLIAAGSAGIATQLGAALLLAAGLVLDTADGRLARLQGSASAFGRWLDQVLDELVDLTLHGSIAWAVFRASGQPGWLVLGMLYAGGKYLFLVQSLTGQTLESHAAHAGSAAATSANPLRSLVQLAGHADVRWHLWIVLAALGRLDLALAAYAFYFPARACAGIARKAVRHA